MNETIKLMEYFYSIDGETKRSGELVWFIRVAGCNLNCRWCDTNMCHWEEGVETNIEELVEAMCKTNECRKVTVTGGEPLLHKNIDVLIWTLLHNGFEVNIETNGSVNPNDILKGWQFEHYRHFGKLWFSLDYKCPGSLMNKKMISVEESAKLLTHYDCLKFVVCDRNDLESAYKRIKAIEKYYNDHDLYDRCTYYISPCFGEIELPSIVDFMKEKNLINRVKFQIQEHKVIWDPNKRGV